MIEMHHYFWCTCIFQSGFIVVFWENSHALHTLHIGFKQNYHFVRKLLNNKWICIYCKKRNGSNLLPELLFYTLTEPV